MGGLDDSATMEITGRIMVVAIVILFLVVVFVIFLHLYAKWFWWRTEEPTHPQQSRQRRQRRRYVFNPGQDPSKDFPDGLECAVCLSDAVEGEKVRNSVAPQAQCASGANNNNDLEVNIQSPEEILVSGYSIESPDFPTNVLFWGDETQVSTGGGSLEEGPSSSASSAPSSSAGVSHDEMLVIDVPVQITDNLAEDQESKLPTPTRLRSLKRLLSREKRVLPNCSNGSVDV
ncbi:hypothetical protein OIU84_022742 [Salix udensis]|uniref:Uncharacterized protein n=1 Tax=Salix udensis TaxID=889485 RepID=A0AAD6KQN9_9ROSI|nr:hypothetical protein OIU84_022742 [Salix udensis]